MAANVLNSTQAVEMSVVVVREFIRLTPFLNPLNGLNAAKRLNDWNGWNGLENKYDEQIQVILMRFGSLWRHRPQSAEKSVSW
jgi:hypothetical protein